MQYTTGDLLTFKGTSGIYRTVFMDRPAESKTITFDFIDCQDGDGNNYPIVTIGTQTWMTENLKTTKYNDGTDIPLVIVDTAWNSLSTPAYCWYNNDFINKVNYGALYNWYTVSTSKLCPKGWHVLSDAEWTVLTTYLGDNAGGKLKEAGFTHWSSPNTVATNESGFTALPGGFRWSSGYFYFVGYNGLWWSSSEYHTNYALSRSALTSPDVYNKTLIVTATVKDQARIKAVIDQADSRGSGALITQAYTVKWANATTISTALANVVPAAKISSDPTNKMLIVTASKEDHQKIQAVLDEADKRGGGDLVTKPYALRTANPSTIMAALLPVVPDAKISADVTNQMLIVTASEEDHLRIKTIVDEADQLADGELVTQVYKLKWANPTALSASIRPVAPRATLSPDIYNKTLIVTATAQDQERIKPIVEQADRRGEGEMSTQVYAFKLANPATVATALGTLMPNATMSSDTTTNTLIVTASAEDHKLIEPIVQQLDVTDPKASILKPYNVQNADPQQVYRSLTQLFRTSRNVSVGFQEETGMILVFAPLADQEEVARAITDIDKATAGRPKATSGSLFARGNGRGCGGGHAPRSAGGRNTQSRTPGRLDQ